MLLVNRLGLGSGLWGCLLLAWRKPLRKGKCLPSTTSPTTAFHLMGTTCPGQCHRSVPVIVLLAGLVVDDNGRTAKPVAVVAAVHYCDCEAAASSSTTALRGSSHVLT